MNPYRDHPLEVFGVPYGTLQDRLKERFRPKQLTLAKEAKVVYITLLVEIIRHSSYFEKKIVIKKSLDFFKINRRS